MTLALALCPLSAEAHLSSTGLGPVYDGIAHFFTSPEDLLSALALALWAGLRGAAHGRRVLLALPGAWLLGALLGAHAPAAEGGALGASLGLLLPGGLLAADAKLSPRATSALAVGLGLHHGYGNGAGLGASWSAAAALLGLAASVFTLVALASAFAAPRRAAWARIAVRVAGSWIAAIGVLTFALAARGG